MRNIIEIMLLILCITWFQSNDMKFFDVRITSINVTFIS